MRKIKIDVTAIQSRRELLNLLDEEMQFEGWYGPKLNDWIEMISVFEPNNTNNIPARFQSSTEELFILEIENAYEMMVSGSRKNTFRYMISIFRRVNREYKRRYNRSVLGLSLL